VTEIKLKARLFLTALLHY